MVFHKALATALVLAAIGALPAFAEDGLSRPQTLAQAAGQRNSPPHFDPTRGDGPQPHNPNPGSMHSSGAPAHFDPPRGDGPQPHRPGAVPGQSGAAVHFDGTQGGGQQPHARDRGAPQPGR